MDIHIHITGGSMEAQKMCRDALYKSLLRVRRTKALEDEKISFEIRATCRGIVSAGRKEESE